MRKHYDFTKPPIFLLKLFAAFRKFKIKRYKKKKVRLEKTSFYRDYFIKFKVKINDPFNPQISDLEYEMVVPAKAAFFAKKKVNSSILNNIEIDFIECELMTEKDIDQYKKSEAKYLEKLES